MALDVAITGQHQYRLKVLYLPEEWIMTLLSPHWKERIHIAADLLPADVRIERVFFDYTQGPQGSFGVIIGSASFDPVEPATQIPALAIETENRWVPERGETVKIVRRKE